MIKALVVIAFISLISCGPKAKDSAKQALPVRKETNTTINLKKTINCFIYHRFGDARYPSTNVPLDDFKAHLRYLKEAGFEVLSLSDAITYLKDSQPVKKVAVITVDDGFKSFYENGLPLLEAYHFPATLFINTETVGGNSYMDWREIKDASERGVEIGNHTHTHAFFLDMDIDERYQKFESEINLCQQLIKKHLGLHPKVFAYPYGEFDDRMKEIVKNTGFIAATAQNSGVIDNETDLLACPRFPMATGFSDISGFKLKANALPMKIAGIPSQHVLSGNYKPGLALMIQKNSLRLDEMQCFIQGGDCEMTMEKKSGDNYALTIKPKQSIRNRRRTLYTLTVPDKNNQWYWFSHLWVNPDIKE